MEKWLGLVLSHPRKVILCILLISLFFILQIPGITLDTDLESNIPSDLPEMQYLEAMNEAFPMNREFAIIGLVFPPEKTVYSLEALEQMYAIAQRCFELDGVEEIISIVTYEDIRVTPFGLSIEPLYDPDTINDTTMEDFKEKVAKVPFLAENFVGKEGQAGAIMVMVDEDKAEKKDYSEPINAILQEVQGPGEMYLGGTVVWETQVADLIQKDLTILLPLAFLVLVIILYISFGTLLGVLIPIGTVFLSVIWTVGLMAFLDIPISLSTMVVPVLLSAMGIAYGIHILNRIYEEKADEQGKGMLVMRSTEQVALAVFMSGFTTIVSFLSLTVSGIPPVRIFGAVSAMGIVIALFLSLTMIPAVLYLLPVTQGQGRAPKYLLRRSIDVFLALMGHIMSRQRWLVTSILLLIILGALLGLPHLTTKVDPIETLPEGDAIRQAFDVINTYFTGVTTLQIILKGEEGAFYDPQLLATMEALEEELKQQEEVGMVQSITMFIKMVNQALYGGSSDYYVLPEDQEELEECYFFLELGEMDDEIAGFVTEDRAWANINVFLRTSSTDLVAQQIDFIDDWAQMHLPASIEVSVTGLGHLYLSLNDLVIEGQIHSLILSLILVFIVVSILFRSLYFGFFSLLTLLSALVLNFGLMGWLQIPIDLSTVTVASIAVGIGVDYSIHFLTRLRREMDQNSLETSIARTIATSGRGIFINALLVMSGFLVLVFSRFQALSYIGILIAVIMVATAVGALTILPLAILNMRPASLRKGNRYHVH